MTISYKHFLEVVKIIFPWDKFFKLPIVSSNFHYAPYFCQLIHLSVQQHSMKVKF